MANAATLAWNSYLHLLQHQRYADALPVLLPVLQLLLQPVGAAATQLLPAAPAAQGAPAGGAAAQQAAAAAAAAAAAVAAAQAAAESKSDRRWQLAARMAEAVAKGAEHIALLQLLKPAAQQMAGVAGTDAGGGAAGAGGAAGGEGGAAALQLLAFRQGDMPGYLDLREARLRAGRELRWRCLEHGMCCCLAWSRRGAHQQPFVFSAAPCRTPVRA